MFVVRWIVVVFLLLVSLATWQPQVRVAGVGPDLLLGVVFLLTLRRGLNWGAWTAFILGLLVAVEEPSALGTESLAYVLAAIVVARGTRSLARGNPLVLVVLLFLCSLTAETVRILTLGAAGAGSVPLLWIRWALPGAVYTTLWLPAMAWVVAWILGSRDWLTGAA